MNYCEKCLSPSLCTDCADGYVLHPLGISCVVSCPTCKINNNNNIFNVFFFIRNC